MNTKHIPLLVAIALPILFIIILAVTLFVPSSKINPEFNFLYIDSSEQWKTSFNTFRYENTYEVENNKIVKKTIIYSKSENLMYEDKIEKKDSPSLYLYDVEENTSKIITFEDAQDLDLEQGPSSPDGYTVKFEYNSDGIFELFGSNNDAGYYITKGSGKKILSGIGSSADYYGQNDIKLIGWIK